MLPVYAHLSRHPRSCSIRRTLKSVHLPSRINLVRGAQGWPRHGERSTFCFAGLFPAVVETAAGIPLT